MIKYILKRLLQMIPVLIGVMIIVFSLSYLMPGDPVLNQMPDNYTQEQYDEVQHEMGLDQPFLVQLGQYIWGVVTRFDLGTSYMTNRAVTTSIAERVWVTIRLGVLSVGVTVLLGIPFGIIFTKADKLSKTQREKSVERFRTALAQQWEELPPMFVSSGERGTGREEILGFIGECLDV